MDAASSIEVRGIAPYVQRQVRRPNEVV